MTCNCPESGTSGSCPFHDASTRFTVEPQPGRWDTNLGRIVTALEDAAYERGRAEATAAAEQRLEAVVGPLTRHAVIPPEYEDYYLIRRSDYDAALRALSDSGRTDPQGLLDAGQAEQRGDSSPSASPRQGEPVEVNTVIRDLARESLARRDTWAGNGYAMEPMPHEALVRAALSEPTEAGAVCPACERAHPWG